MPEYRYRDLTASDGYGWGWRMKIEKGKRKGVLQKKDRTSVYPYGEIENFINDLRTTAAQYEHPRVDTDSVTGYYDSVEYTFYVEGWRDATPEDIAAHEEEVRQSQENIRRFDEQQIARLKAHHPELFK